VGAPRKFRGVIPAIDKENSMLKTPTLALFGLLSFSVALTAQDVTYNYDQSANFSKFKTYKWVSIKDAMQPDQLIDQQIKAAIDAELAKKGLSKTDDDKADLYVGYQLALGQEKQLNSYNTGGGGWGYGARWGGGMTTTTTSTIHIGTLVLDMYDPAAKQLVWRGQAQKTIDANAKPDKRQKNLAKAVAKLLKNYPPAAKK
jgi:hypothetical protein